MSSYNVASCNALLTKFEADFIQSIPDGIRPDVIARLKNPQHAGKGVSNNDVIKLVRSISASVIYNNEALSTFQSLMKKALIEYKSDPRNEKSIPAAKSAELILSKLFMVRVFPLSEIPDDIKKVIANHVLSKQQLNDLRLVSKDFCKVIDENPPHAYLLCKTSGLLSKRLSLIKIARNNFEGVYLFRNAEHVLHNMRTALKKYAITGDLNQTIEATENEAQGGTSQPKTVLATFKNAFDKSLHGGFQQTIDAAKEAIEKKTEHAELIEKYIELLPETVKIVEFLKTLDLNNKQA